MIARIVTASVKVALFCLFALGIEAQSIPWPHPDGSLHWYELVRVPTGISWTDAQAQAHARNGHLVTVTSTAERDAVFQLIDDPTAWFQNAQGVAFGPWVGGVQRTGSFEPLGGWQWVTGEAFTYSNWAAGQPDDMTGDQGHLHFGDGSGLRVATWSDRHVLGTVSTQPGAQRSDIRSYVIEWDGHSPTQTVGQLIHKPGASEGTTLIATISGDGSVPLVDANGHVVHSWNFTEAFGYTPYLLDDGDLIRSLQMNAAFLWNGIFVGGLAGAVERRAWDGTLEWRYVVNSNAEISHHDIEPLPNGNVLITVYEHKTAAEAIAMGRDPALLPEGQLWPDKIIEVQPTGPTSGAIVWEWKVWDHLVQDFDPALPNYGDPAAHPELIDLNFAPTGIADWTHVNSVEYNAELDQVLLTVHCLDEIWIIDHSTTLSEAAGHSGGLSGKGGDLLYRWGNPAAYRAGTAQDRVLFGPHHADWIEAGSPGAGNILLFNNGLGRGAATLYSTIDELTAPRDANGNYVLQSGAAYGPSTLTWQYVAPNPADFYSPIVSGAQRLASGNTLIASGTPGRIFEVTPQGEEIWRYKNAITEFGPITQGAPPAPCLPLGPCSRIFRATKYATSHPGLAGRSLLPGDPVEAYPPEIAARFGAVGLAEGAREPVLSVNGSAGDVWREVWVDGATPVTVAIDAPGSVAGSSHYILFAFGGEPGPFDLEVQPLLMGTSAFPFPFLTPGFLTGRGTFADSLNTGILGQALIPNAPEAPATLLQSVLPLGTFTLQGISFDDTALSDLSVTNAVVVTVY